MSYSIGTSVSEAVQAWALIRGGEIFDFMWAIQAGSVFSHSSVFT
jgi:hypothetical protein